MGDLFRIHSENPGDLRPVRVEIESLTDPFDAPGWKEHVTVKEKHMGVNSLLQPLVPCPGRAGSDLQRDQSQLRSSLPLLNHRSSSV